MGIPPHPRSRLPGLEAKSLLQKVWACLRGWLLGRGNPNSEALVDWGEGVSWLPSLSCLGSSLMVGAGSGVGEPRSLGLLLFGRKSRWEPVNESQCSAPSPCLVRPAPPRCDPREGGRAVGGQLGGTDEEASCRAAANTRCFFLFMI